MNEKRLNRLCRTVFIYTHNLRNVLVVQMTSTDLGRLFAKDVRLADGTKESASRRELSIPL